MDTTTRLAKILSRHGIASRRKSEEIIRQGRVKVNNVKVLDPAFQVDYKLSSVTVDGIKLKDIATRTYIALYKPVKHISDLNYDDDRALARELLPGKEYLFPVGRLDYNSEGLMIFTDDG
ncbi:MAG: S4 domain-containing protein, partial [Syntrophorhabdus sp.]